MADQMPRQEQVRLAARLLRMKPSVVRAIEMHLYEGHTQKAAAAACGTRQHVVSRALRRLRQTIQEIEAVYKAS